MAAATGAAAAVKTKRWNVEFDREDDLGTSLDPEEIKVENNEVVALSGTRLKLQIHLRKSVRDLTPEKISVVRHRAEWSDVPPMRAVAVSPA